MSCASRLDYTGIAVLICGSFYPLIWFLFPCAPLARKVRLACCLPALPAPLWYLRTLCTLQPPGRGRETVATARLEYRRQTLPTSEQQEFDANEQNRAAM